MNIAVWGTKKEAIYAAEKIELDNQNKVICFVDNDEEKWGDYIGEKPILPLSE